jgi:hypothetical protein
MPAVWPFLSLTLPVSVLPSSWPVLDAFAGGMADGSVFATSGERAGGGFLTETSYSKIALRAYYIALSYRICEINCAPKTLKMLRLRNPICVRTKLSGLTPFLCLCGGCPRKIAGPEYASVLKIVWHFGKFLVASHQDLTTG